MPHKYRSGAHEKGAVELWEIFLFLTIVFVFCETGGLAEIDHSHTFSPITSPCNVPQEKAVGETLTWFLYTGFNRHGCLRKMEIWRGEYGAGGNVNLLLSLCDLCTLVFKLHSKNFNKIYLYMEEKSIHIQMNIYIYIIFILLFILLFLFFFWMILKCYKEIRQL